MSLWGLADCQRASGRDIRPRVFGQNHANVAVIAEAQKAGGTCAFIDAEHALDPLYAQALGVNTDDLLVSQPDTGEQALEICDMLVAPPL